MTREEVDLLADAVCEVVASEFKGFWTPDEIAQDIRTVIINCAIRLNRMAKAEHSDLRMVLKAFVETARLGSGNKPVTRSSRVNCPSYIYYDAVQCLAEFDKRFRAAPPECPHFARLHGGAVCLDCGEALAKPRGEAA